MSHIIASASFVAAAQRYEDVEVVWMVLTASVWTGCTAKSSAVTRASRAS